MDDEERPVNTAAVTPIPERPERRESYGATVLRREKDRLTREISDQLGEAGVLLERSIRLTHHAAAQVAHMAEVDRALRHLEG